MTRIRGAVEPVVVFRMGMPYSNTNLGTRLQGSSYATGHGHDNQRPLASICESSEVSYIFPVRRTRPSILPSFNWNEPRCHELLSIQNDLTTLSSDIAREVKGLMMLLSNQLMITGTYELGPIHSVINDSPVLHVSFASAPEDPFPAILPMIGVMASFEYPSSAINEPLDCYLHGYVSSRIMRLAKDSDRGLAVCVAATKVDGLVLSLTPNSHSYNYRSAVLQGYARPVESTEEKVWAMERITNKVLAERWQNTRIPPDNVEMTSTTILKVTIETGSGKIRHGEPHDDKKDLSREDVINSVWTGVVPVYETFDAPIPSATNKAGDVPSYITSYIKSTTEANKLAAIDAIKE